MQDEVTGNLTGLKASEIKALERLYRRRVTPTEVVSGELATQLAAQSAQLHRQVGVLIDRRGAIQHAFVGDASKIVLPDVGRMRGGHGRFRGLRLVHTLVDQLEGQLAIEGGRGLRFDITFPQRARP